MIKSIRWTFLTWQAVLLLAVIAGFGSTLFLFVRHALLEEAHAELEGSVNVLAAGLHMRGPGPPGRHHRGGRRRRVREAFERRMMEEMRRDGFSPAHLARLKGRIRVPEPFIDRFGDGVDGSPYFVIWLPGGEVLKEVNKPADLEVPSVPAGAPEVHFRERGDIREAYLRGPRGSVVLAGRSIEGELAELTDLVWQISATGLCVLLVGLAGGWFLAKRAVRPIEAISEAAEKVSALNLSQRIDIEAPKSELGQLADILNTTFSRLQAAFEQQMRFTADASHELRTPVSVILAQTESALRKERTPQEYREVIEACHRASLRMKRLVDGLLTLARSDAGELKLEQQRCDLKKLVEESAHLLEPLAAEKQVSIDLDLDPVEVAADPERMTQVVSNLVSNAIRYNHEGGSVRIVLHAEGQQVVLKISDTGVGIPSKDQRDVFERFYRADKARSRRVGGSGLGLAICKTIVDAHHGDIGVVSEGEKGTTFTVALPRQNGSAL